MKLEMTVKDRLGITELFPPRADMQTQGIVRDIMEKVRIKPEEEEEIGLKQMPGPVGGTSLNWDIDKTKALMINFSKAEGRFLKRRVNEKDKEESIALDTLALCEKIQAAETKTEEGPGGEL